MTSSRASPKAPQVNATPQQLARGIAMLADGRSDAFGEVTLTTGTTTVVSAPAVSAESAVFVSPVTASAAGLDIWVSAQANGTFTLNHPAGASGRTVRYAWIG